MRVVAASRRRPRGHEAVTPSARLGGRLLALAGIGALAAIQWASLIVDPPGGRLAIEVVVALATAAALAALGRRELPRVVRVAATLGVAVAGLAAALIVLGVPAVELLPWHWGRFASDVDLGLAGLSGTFDYPFDGENEWSRLLLVVAMPLLLVLAATLGFRPGRRDGPGAGALIVLIAAFAIPATIRPTPAPILWGALLLALTAAWLWGRRLRTLPALAILACFGAVAIPVASWAASDEPLIDYRTWTLPEAAGGVGFQWDHQYGPIDWPRTGTPLFRVRSDQPRYWRAEVLDDFFATGWRRSPSGGAPVPSELTGNQPSESLKRRWLPSADFSILSLKSPLLISPGTAVSVRGISGIQRDPDGTVHADAQPLTKGSEYTVTAYAPDPGSGQMRAGSRSYSTQLAPYTEVALPFGTTSSGSVAASRIDVPPWGSGAPTGEIDSTIAASPYARLAGLAQRLTASEPTAYDAVKAVENHLRDNYTYDESPPESDQPLNAFLFEDRIGYCQQFSGAMALMLRLSGIPARVAVGFAPGKRVAPGRDEWEVTDLDAHSWVEVYFNGIGWVPFDPTPSDAPAESQAGGLGIDSAALGAGALGLADKLKPKGGGPLGDVGSLAGPAKSAAPGGSGGPGWAVLLALLLPGVTATGLVALRASRHRSLPADRAAELELHELAAALGPAGWGREGRSTLLRLEGRLRARRMPSAAAYVRRLRELRYGRVAGRPPTLAERRATRRELAGGGGARRRLRLLIAMPPGGPRRQGR